MQCSALQGKFAVREASAAGTFRARRCGQGTSGTIFIKGTAARGSRERAAREWMPSFIAATEPLPAAQTIERDVRGFFSFFSLRKEKNMFPLRYTKNLPTIFDIKSCQFLRILDLMSYSVEYVQVSKDEFSCAALQNRYNEGQKPVFEINKEKDPA